MWPHSILGCCPKFALLSGILGLASPSLWSQVRDRIRVWFVGCGFGCGLAACIVERQRTAEVQIQHTWLPQRMSAESSKSDLNVFEVGFIFEAPID